MRLPSRTPPRVLVPDEKAAPLVYVVIERDEWPDSVWWTRDEAEARVRELRSPEVVAYLDGSGDDGICEMRVGDTDDARVVT